jgi:hypothetical protein
MLSAGPALLFDRDEEVRLRAQEVVPRLIAKLPDSVRQEAALKTWEVLSKLLETIRPDRDWVIQLRFRHDELLVNSFVSLNPHEIDQLIPGASSFVSLNPHEIDQLIEVLPIMVRLAINAWDRLSSEQREAVNIAQFLEADSEKLRELAQDFAVTHFRDLAHLKSALPKTLACRPLDSPFVNSARARVSSSKSSSAL